MSNEQEIGKHFIITKNEDFLQRAEGVDTVQHYIKTELPFWFKQHRGRKAIKIIEVHFIPTSIQTEEGEEESTAIAILKALSLNKAIKSVSVHSNLSAINTEYSNKNNTGLGGNDNFVCYTNVQVQKVYEAEGNIGTDFVEFWLKDHNGIDLADRSIRSLRIELELLAS
jgi:hypothetical protein